MTALNFCLLSNHTIAPFLDLMTREYTRDTKVVHFIIRAHLVRKFEGTKADLQP